MKSGSLFTGTAALDMAAAEVLGCEPAWFCDVDPGASALLAHHYPHVPNLGDITAVDWTAVEPVEVLTGGFPCQDISNAGRREGITGARSGLWSYYADAIRVFRPRYVLIENVSALVVRGLDRVLADLAALGFDAEWATVRASDVGAPHRRERIFITAANTEGDRWHEGRAEPTRLVRRSDAAERSASPAHPDGGRRGAVEPHDDAGQPDTARGDSAASAHTDCGGRGRDQGDSGRGEVERTAADRHRAGSAPLAHAYGDGREVVERGQSRLVAQHDAHGRGTISWGVYEPAIRRWEAIVGRGAPAPTVVGTRGGRVLNPALPEWMMGLPEGWITSVPGLSRNAQLKLAGNGVVPQQAVAAFRHLLPLLVAREVAA